MYLNVLLAQQNKFHESSNQKSQGKNWILKCYSLKPYKIEILYVSPTYIVLSNLSWLIIEEEIGFSDI